MMDASAEVIKMGAVLKCHSREYMVPFLHNWNETHLPFGGQF